MFKLRAVWLLLGVLTISSAPRNKIFYNVNVLGGLSTQRLRVTDVAQIANLFVGHIQSTGSPGSGIIQGPSSSTPGAVAIFANSTGDQLANSSVLIDGQGNVTLNGITKDGNTVSWPTIVGAAGTFLSSDGAGNLVYATPAGSGNVSTALNFTLNNAITRTDTASSVTNIKQSTVIIDDSANITGVNSLATSGITLSGTLNVLTQNEVRFQDAAGGQYVGFQAPATVPTSYTVAWPTTVPTASQFLRASATPTQLEWISGGGSVTPAVSRTIYVTKYGNDTTGDGSFTTPYASLAKAIDTANGISTALSPVTILISAGVYTENNSTGPLAITAAGISIIGSSPNAVIIVPGTLSQNLISSNVAVRFASISFVVPSGTSTAAALALAGTSVNYSISNVLLSNFNTAVTCSGTSNIVAFDFCAFRQNGTAISVNGVTVTTQGCLLEGSASNASPANTGIAATGSSAIVIVTGGALTRFVTGITAQNNAVITAQAVAFRNTTNDMVATSAGLLQAIGCSFQANQTSGIDAQATGAGSSLEINGCYFDGRDSLGVPQGTAVKVSAGATCTIAGGQIEDFITGIQVGVGGDTSSTSLIATSLGIFDCSNSIVQSGTATLSVNTCSLDGSLISLNDTTNVVLSFFDQANNNVLNIGKFADENTTLLHAAIAASNEPEITYLSSLYSTQGVGLINTGAGPTSWFAESYDTAQLMAITSDRTKLAGLRLASDTASPVGGTTALRGWDINKNGSAAELAFKYQNTDTTGQIAVPQYTVVQLDGLNNQLQLPTAATQIVFSTDTNLYRSSANILATDDNLIIGGLTASRAVATNGSKQLVSSATTATELGYVSGVTSSIQDQLNNKVSRSGDTMTGQLQLIAGTAGTPALTFTGSTSAGLFASSGSLGFSTSGTNRMGISSAGTVSILDAPGGFTTAGVVHNDASGNLTSSFIVNADVSDTAAITDGKLATITTAGKVANSATTATSTNTASAIVARDASGNFSAGTITASLTGNVTGAASLNVLKAGDTMSGALTLPAGTAGSPSLKFSGSTNTGLSAATANQLSFDTNGTERMTINGSGTVTIAGLATAGVVHTDGSGSLSTSSVVNSDIANATITNAKLATISSTNTGGNIVVRDGSGNFAATMITLSGVVANATDAATKEYVDSVTSTGIDPKTPALLASTTNITISGIQTVDGTSTATGNRILLVGQSSPIQNGLWVANDGGAWTRPADFNTGDAAGPAYVLVTSGSSNAGASWLCSTPTAIIGTDPIQFTQFSIPGQTTGANVGAGAGQIFKDKTGNTINFKTIAAGTHMVVTNNTNDVTLATDATNANTVSTIVARDGSGNFSAGTITASLTGLASLNLPLTGGALSGALNMLTQNELRWQDAAGGQYVGLQAPATVPSSYTLAWPAAAPTASQFLRASSTPTQLEWVTGGGSITPAASYTIYVTKYGSDITGDGSFTTPYASLSKAVDTANGISTASTPVTIQIASGVYTEDNSTGPIAVTSDGISIVGASASAVFIKPGTLSNDLVSTTVGTRFVNLTFDAVAGSSAAGLSFSGVGNTSNMNNVRVFNFATGVACGGTFGSYELDECVLRTNGVGLAADSAVVVLNECSVAGSLTTTPANTGITATGAGCSLLMTGGLYVRCTTCITINNNAILNLRAGAFKNNTNVVVASGGSNTQINGCTFQLNPTGGINIDVSGAGTILEATGCYFNGKDLLGVAQGSACQVSGEGSLQVVASVIEYYVTAITVGDLGDTASTIMQIGATDIANCTSDIVQNGSTTLNFNAGSTSSTKISVNDPTNVKLAYFDPADDNTLKIGALSNENISLLRALIATTNSPRIDYLSSLYSTEAMGMLNPQNAPTSWYVSTNNNTGLVVAPTDRSKIAGLRLMSDTGGTLGGTTALRGWDINKNPSSAELSFQYRNSDATGQSTVSTYTVVQFDGVNNQLQLPTAGTKIVYATDTNLYRSAANTLKTDGNIIIAGLTASRAVATDGSKQLVSSTATATELGYLSGVTSAIQTQLDGKVSKSGDTMTGALQLPAGTAGAPSLKFTGSTTTGLFASSGALGLTTSGVNRLGISSSGTVSILDAAGGFATAGVVHNDASGNLSSSLIVNADVDAAAAIVDTKLATISTAGKVANSATTATSTNTASAIVARDVSGNFSAGTITADLIGNVTGTVSGALPLTGGTLTGALTLPQGTTTVPTLRYTGSTNTGISTSAANVLSLITTGSEHMRIDGAGLVSVASLATLGVVHSDGTGLLSSSLITNQDVSASAGIVDTKLATISTAGKVSNSATTATSANTASAIVARDGSGNFSAGTITASLTGAASLNVLKAGDTMTGTLTHPAGSAAAPSIQFTGSTNTGISAATANTLSFDTNGNERLSIGATGTIAVPAFTTAGVVHNAVTTGALSSSLIVNADVDPAAAIVDTKLATISTAGKVSNSATTATSANTASAIVARDGSGNFSAGTITASLTGAASLNVLKAGDTMTGTLTLPAGSAATPSLQFTGSTNTGISAATANTLSFDTNGTERMSISTTAITMPTAVVLTNLFINQAIQVVAPTNNSTVTTNATTSILLLTHPANRTNVTVNFPPSPTNGQIFTMMLGTTSSITLNLAGGTGGASVVNGITTLNTAAPGATTGGPTATYLYYSTANTWYLMGR